MAPRLDAELRILDRQIACLCGQQVCFRSEVGTVSSTSVELWDGVRENFAQRRPHRVIEQGLRDV